MGQRGIRLSISSMIINDLISITQASRSSCVSPSSNLASRFSTMPRMSSPVISVSFGQKRCGINTEPFSALFDRGGNRRIDRGAKQVFGQRHPEIKCPLIIIILAQIRPLK